MDELEELKKLINFNDVFNLLYTLGADPRIQDNIIIARTICHGGHSHKLYYYENTKLFKCYTECSETFDIAQLIMKINNGMTLPQAINYLKQFFGIIILNKKFSENEDILEDWKILNNYLNKDNENDNKRTVEMKIFEKEFLNNFPQPRILNWEEEGITFTAVKDHNIRYDPTNDGIIIPHYDKDNNLIGIRERTLIKENEEGGKYKPMIINRQMYNHPLGFSLYNLNNSKDNIKQSSKCIIFEGEKSCLLYESYFGKENDISVACCGSSLSSYQVQLLLDLGVSEIIISFDKQFQELNDNEYKGWIKKLKDINKKYNKFVQISFIFDKKDLLDYKMSPIDRGPEIFEQLWKQRFSIEE